MSEKNSFRCEDCYFFNESNVPADCNKGHGKVAYMRQICSDFKLNSNNQIDSKTEIKN